MAFATASKGNTTIGDINVTPLVDVMLVLLVIFMIATPLLSRPIETDLPVPGPEPLVVPDTVRLQIDNSGALTWNGYALPMSALVPTLRVEATRDPQPILELETSPDANYAVFADVLATAKQAGMTRIGFVAP